MGKQSSFFSNRWVQIAIVVIAIVAAIVWRLHDVGTDPPPALVEDSQPPSTSDNAVLPCIPLDGPDSYGFSQTYWINVPCNMLPKRDAVQVKLRLLAFNGDNSIELENLQVKVNDVPLTTMPFVINETHYTVVRKRSCYAKIDVCFSFPKGTDQEDNLNLVLYMEDHGTVFHTNRSGGAAHRDSDAVCQQAGTDQELSYYQCLDQASEGHISQHVHITSITLGP